MTLKAEPRIHRAFPSPGQSVLLAAAFLGVQIVSGIVVTIVMMVVAAAQKRGGAAPEMPLGAMLGVNVVAFTVVAAWSFAATRGRWREILLGGRAGVGAWLAALPLLGGTTLLVAEFSNLQQMVMPVPAAMEKLMRGMVDLSAQPVVTLLLIVVLAPVGEEFLFRGMILRGLLERLRPWQAIGLSTALFTAIHLNPWQVPAGLGLGLLCGWVYLRTRSLTLCILLHLLNNAAAIFVNQLPWRIPGLVGEGAHVQHLPWWLLAAAVGALGLGWVLFNRSTRQSLEPPPLPSPESAPVAAAETAASTAL